MKKFIFLITILLSGFLISCDDNSVNLTPLPNNNGVAGSGGNLDPNAPDGFSGMGGGAGASGLGGGTIPLTLSLFQPHSELAEELKDYQRKLADQERISTMKSCTQKIHCISSLSAVSGDRKINENGLQNSEALGELPSIRYEVFTDDGSFLGIVEAEELDFPTEPTAVTDEGLICMSDEPREYSHP